MRDVNGREVVIVESLHRLSPEAGAAMRQAWMQMFGPRGPRLLMLDGFRVKKDDRAQARLQLAAAALQGLCGRRGWFRPEPRALAMEAVGLADVALRELERTSKTPEETE